ncbi:MAG TPA: CBS domain-containing protein [Candidatus Eremiobacteraeota bacterium]|nr:MAG: Hypoxic response protein 1 [bacterium ADurb.Bin363]HPZ09187.1 CBS domain-containing protein [Candidatus Eremiobacteraeota bacterium]
MKAKDVMTKKVITVSSELSIRKLILLLLTERISGVPVVDAAGEVIGIISERDILKAVDRLIKVKVSLDEERQQGASNWVDGIMTKEVIFVSEDDPIEDVCKLMSEKKIHRVPVMKGKKIVGIITSMDILKTVASFGILK